MTVQEGQPLPDEVLVFRELRYKTDLDQATGRAKSDAFIPRPMKDLNGLSLTLHGPAPNPYVCMARKPCFGLADLLPTQVRGIHPNLQILFDGGRHCLLKGIPTQRTPDHELAESDIRLQERIASALASISQMQACSLHP